APITFYCRDHTVEHVRALVAAARAFITAHPLPHVQFRLAGGFIGIMDAIYDEILRSQARMTVASLLAIVHVLVPPYHSVTAALRFVGEMAALLALWMVSSAATALVVLPALLVVIRPRFLVAERDERPADGQLAAF